MNESTLDMQAIQENTQFLGKVRLISAVFSGLAAGIFGFTNLIGFAWYYFIYLFTSTLLLVKVCYLSQCLERMCCISRIFCIVGLILLKM